MLDEAAAEYKQQVINNTINAIAGAPPLSTKAACQACHRVDLQVLVVTPSVVPQAHAQALRDAGYAWAPSFDAEFANIKREATVPVARIARTGYIKLYFAHNERWDVWQVMANGLIRKIMHQVNAKQYAKMQDGFVNAPEPKQCSRGAANLPGHLISISGAKNIDTVWLAYTPRMWSPTVLQQFTDNPMVDVPGPDGKPAGKKKLRDLRGRELHPKKIVMQGEFPKTGCLPLNALALEHNVADFVKAASPAYKKAFELALRPLDSARFGQAQAFENAVRVAEKVDHPTLYVNKSVLLMLPDDVGVVEQHNHLRLCAMEAKKSWSIGGPDENGKNADPMRAWKLRSSLHIDVIEGWAKAQARDEVRQYVTREMNKNLAPVTEEDYQRGISNGTYPSGTTWEPTFLRETDWKGPVTGKSQPVLGSDGQPVPQTVASRQHPGQQTRLGRLSYPSAQIKQVADKHYGGSTTQGRIPRYQEKLRYGELVAFKNAFKAASEQWDKYIAHFDHDLATWRAQPSVAITLRHDFNHAVNLAKPKAEHGSAAAQAEEIIARMEAVDKAWGGGAASIKTTQELVALLNKSPDDPSNWIDNALLAPFNLASEIANDKGKLKDSAEKVKGMIELPGIVKEALHARHERLERVTLSLMVAREQALNIATAAVDADHAKAINITALSPAQVERHYKIHVRTAAVLTEVLNPGEVYATVRVKLPLGETLDAVSAAFAAGALDMTLEAKNTTTRQERRTTTRTLRKLAGRPGLATPEFYPLILRQDALNDLAKQAAKSGEALVEVIADDTLGGSAQSFKLPKSVAVKLVAQQASMAKAAKQTVMSRQGFGIGVVVIFQVGALLDALKKIKSAQGYDYVDSLMSVFTASTGLAEGGLSLWSAYYDIKAQGSKLVLAPTLTRAARVRLAAGVFGAAGSAFDAVASWAKYQSRKQRGDSGAATHYLWATGAYAVSGVSLLAGTSAIFAREMSKRATTSAVGAVSEMVVLRLGGAAATAYLGASLTGIGIVLSIGGFGWTLYAQYMEDDLNEVFLKRSYWGIGHDQGALGRNRPEPPANEAGQRLNWVQLVVRDEQDAFGALSVGFKAQLVWHDNWVGENQLQARIECANPTEKRLVDYTLIVKDSKGQMLANISNRAVVPTLDEEANRYAIDVRVPMKSALWEVAHTAEFAYNVYEEFERVSVGRDTLIVRKKA